MPPPMAAAPHEAKPAGPEAIVPPRDRRLQPLLPDEPFGDGGARPGTWWPRWRRAPASTLHRRPSVGSRSEDMPLALRGWCETSGTTTATRSDQTWIDRGDQATSGCRSAVARRSPALGPSAGPESGMPMAVQQRFSPMLAAAAMALGALLRMLWCGSSIVRILSGSPLKVFMGYRFSSGHAMKFRLK